MKHHGIKKQNLGMYKDTQIIDIFLSIKRF